MNVNDSRPWSEAVDQSFCCRKVIIKMHGFKVRLLFKNNVSVAEIAAYKYSSSYT